MALNGEKLEFNLRKCGRKGHLTFENPSLRRFSASYNRSFREENNSSRTTFTISSTASSPGYSLTDEIDPSNYSFTSALKALQAKTMKKNNCDWPKQEGIELNWKWNEAEKYICNPLSGEVPMECLSSKTLNSRSFRNLSTISTPLMILPSNHNLNINPRTTNPNVRIIHEDPTSPDHVLIQEKKDAGLKRDVGVQSAPVNVSPENTPPMERSTTRQVEADDSPVEYSLELKAQQKGVLKDVKLEEEKQNIMTKEKKEEKKKKKRSGLFSWIRKRQKQATKSKSFLLICVGRLIKAF